MEVVAIKAEKRQNLGSKGSRVARKKGLVPGVMYSSEGNMHFSVDKMSLKNLVYTPKFKLAEIDIDGTNHKCILKDIQFHPQTDEIQHIDLLKLEDGRTVNVQVPIELTGKAVGVATGGKLYQKVRKAKIKTLAENLIDKVTLDVSELQLGQSVRIRDIELGEGIEITNSPGIPVASVETPRALRSAKAAEEAAEGEEGAAEGEEGAEEGATEGEDS